MRTWLLLLIAATLLAACGTEGGPGEPLRLLTSRPPAAYLGERYQASFPASGGVRPYDYKLQGKLPKGLSFANGKLIGTPREKGSFKLSLVVSDAAMSSRSASFVLRVSDPPPPRLLAKLPASLTDAPYIAVFKLDGRPASAMRLRVYIKGQKPDLGSFKAYPGALYVLRYDEKNQALDVDAVFPKALKDAEVFRIRLEPLKKMRPSASSKAQFYDAKGEPYTASPPKRPADKGKYAFDNLRALAALWPRPESKKAPAAAGEKPPAKSAPAAKEKPPAPAAAKQPQKDAAAKDKDPRLALADLNKDGKVDAADLELLRSSYAFNPGGKSAAAAKKGESPKESPPAQEAPAAPQKP